MSNTQLRILSAAVMILLVGFCLYYSPYAVLGMISFFAVIGIDEVYTQFLKRKRWTFYYFVSQLFYLLPLVVIFILDPYRELQTPFVNAALVLNVFLLVYLFGLKVDTRMLIRITRLFPPLGSLLIALPMISLCSLLEHKDWRQLVIVLLVVNFSMDTGAWFVGRKFGKRKLWPSVSPKKTREGFFGGILTSAILGSLVWYAFFDQLSLYSLGIFGFLGAMAQVGDLVQSKMKRQFEIKDSSQLIPGHGGFYDRIDSLVFLAPFYTSIVNTYYF